MGFMGFLDRMDSKVKADVKKYRKPANYAFLMDENEVAMSEGDLDLIGDDQPQNVGGDLDAEYGSEDDDSMMESGEGEGSEGEEGGEEEGEQEKTDSESDIDDDINPAD